MPKVLEDIGAEEASVNTENSKISAHEICMSTVNANYYFCITASGQNFSSTLGCFTLKKTLLQAI
jgi:hypothetical protein